MLLHVSTVSYASAELLLAETGEVSTSRCRVEKRRRGGGGGGVGEGCLMRALRMCSCGASKPRGRPEAPCGRRRRPRPASSYQASTWETVEVR